MNDKAPIVWEPNAFVHDSYGDEPTVTPIGVMVSTLQRVRNQPECTKRIQCRIIDQIDVAHITTEAISKMMGIETPTLEI